MLLVLEQILPLPVAPLLLPRKQAFVTPIYKAGEKTDPQNYCPISLTSIICKTMEHIICSHLMHHLDTHNILLDTQFGFRSHHSCKSQLLLTIDDLARGINNRQQIDIGILNFSKAFDKVPHLRLLHKLEHYGVVGNILTSFLSGRSQQVTINGILSSSVEVTSGVPQAQS